MPDVVTISASQIKKYQRCPRQWAYRYIEKRPEPSSKSAELGSEIHKVLEDYFRWDVDTIPDDKVGKIAKSGLHLLPSRMTGEPAYPRQDIVVEHPFTFEFEGAMVRGYIDMTVKGSPLVIDHKTSSNPRKYGLNDETLAADIQAVMYAYAKFYDSDIACDSDVVNLEWVYYTTSRFTPAYKVCASLDKPQVESKMDELRPTIREMVHARKTHKHALPLAPNAEACGDFGGCPHASVCDVGQNPDHQLAILWGDKSNGKGNKNMGLKELAAQRRKAQNLDTPTPQAATPLARNLNPPEAPANTADEIALSEATYQKIAPAQQPLPEKSEFKPITKTELEESIDRQREAAPKKQTKRKKAAKKTPKTAGSLHEFLVHDFWCRMASAHGSMEADRALEQLKARFGE